MTGWWFGCHFLFSHILGIIIPIDFHIFQRGSNHQPDDHPPKICGNSFSYDLTGRIHAASRTPCGPQTTEHYVVVASLRRLAAFTTSAPRRGAKAAAF